MMGEASAQMAACLDETANATNSQKHDLGVRQ